MALTRSKRIDSTLEVLSSILNWVCPECGGRMGGHGQEFKCQGRCQNDWRQVWEQAVTAAR